ncbi:helix-turn-helix transcriptional regulator [Arcanobacterium sp. S3PF19]|uniref:ArsR/SmtB family transcription factor n=1 Tax=Arcanobacterium sp. S3PF19 TaxID=1219585 RepID=UPI00050E8193|nr:metalloregulator ArsR/SmtB family transcription factor [Arcanobacterium sp. S3PF19]KGF05893.1 hypothetical protein HMPREF1631_03455 [Arcanobacterium sp. S3PF19]
MAMNYCDADALATVFHALSEPTRLTILRHLSRGEHRVCDLVKHLDLAQSTVSKHLLCLQNCGLVECRAEGRASWFSLVNCEKLGAVIRAAMEMLKESDRILSFRAHQRKDEEGKLS